MSDDSGVKIEDCLASPAEELVDLNDIEAVARARRLPAVLGMSVEHITVTDRMLNRVTSLLAGMGLKVENYAVQSNYYGGVDETVRIETQDKIVLSITITTRK